MRVRYWLLAAALLGCKYQPKIRAGVIACEPGSACPAPYVCVVKAEGDSQGLCDLAPGDADVQVAVDAAPVPARLDGGGGPAAPLGAGGGPGGPPPLAPRPPPPA